MGFGPIEVSSPVSSLSEQKAGVEADKDGRGRAATVEHCSLPQETAMGAEATLHLLQPTVLDSYCREALRPVLERAVLTSGSRDTQAPRQGIPVVLRRTGRISEVQKVLRIGVVHVSSGLQRICKARHSAEEALPLKGGKCQGGFPQRTAFREREVEDLHHC